MVILTPKFVKLENGISSRQTDRQTDKQTEKQTDNQTDKQTISSRQKPLFMFVLHDSFGYSSSRVIASKGAFFRIYSSLFLISSPFGSIT